MATTTNSPGCLRPAAALPATAAPPVVASPYNNVRFVGGRLQMMLSPHTMPMEVADRRSGDDDVGDRDDEVRATRAWFKHMMAADEADHARSAAPAPAAVAHMGRPPTPPPRSYSRERVVQALSNAALVLGSEIEINALLWGVDSQSHRPPASPGDSGNDTDTGPSVVEVSPSGIRSRHPAVCASGSSSSSSSSSGCVAPRKRLSRKQRQSKLLMRKPRMTAAPGGGDYHVASSSLGMASLDVSVCEIEVAVRDDSSEDEDEYVLIRGLFDKGSLYV